MIRLATRAISILALLTLAACTVGPAYHRPIVDTPVAFKEAYLSPEQARKWMIAHPSEGHNRGQWWRIFNDPRLNSLEETALSANHDLQAAAARVKQARALSQGSRSDLFPHIDAGFGPTRQRPSNVSQDLPADADNPPYTTWRAQTTISYEADVFGRVASNIDAAHADEQRTEALFRSVQLALQADVAQAYFQLRKLDADEALYRKTVALRSDAVQQMRHRYAAGAISELNVARASTELASAQSQAMRIARRRAEAEHALAILLGKPPADFTFSSKPLEPVDIDVPAGMPSSLLQRRPDIAAAERAMAAANARVGVAKSAFFPRVQLTGAFGYESSELGDLFQWSSRTFLLGPIMGTIMSLPIFDGGRNQAHLDQARARYEEQVANYRQAVLVAFKEVEDSLANLRILGKQTQVQDQAVQAASRAAHMLHTQYREGSISYLNVIDGDRVLLQQQRASVELDAQQIHSTIALIRALGGGWNAPSPAAS
jgi:multidrug efflux system outer membrane protein